MLNEKETEIKQNEPTFVAPLYKNQIKSSKWWLSAKKKLTVKAFEKVVIVISLLCIRVISIKNYHPKIRIITQMLQYHNKVGWNPLSWLLLKQERLCNLMCWRLLLFFHPTGSPAQHSKLELERGRWRNLPCRAEAGVYCPELPCSRPVHHAGKPFLHEVFHQGNHASMHGLKTESITNKGMGWITHFVIIATTQFCLLILDWGGHVAKVLPGRSLQWNVHRVPVECLCGFVLPSDLRVRTFKYFILFPKSFLFFHSLTSLTNTKIINFEVCSVSIFE